jgi:hypothetical protein
VAELADATDLNENLSGRRETGDAELPKFGETSNGNPEPSRAMSEVLLILSSGSIVI